MLEKSLINSEKSYAFYAGGLALVMVVSLLFSNVPELSLSRWVVIPYHKAISSVLFIVGALLGAGAVYRHTLRAQMPWAIPQSQVSWPYVGFIFCSVLALLLGH